MFSQIIYTVRNSLRSKPYIYLLILLTQIVSLICVFFSYGLVYNAFTEFEDASFESRFFYADIINRYDETKTDEELYGGKMQYEEFQAGLDDIRRNIEDNPADILVHGMIKVGGKYLSVSSYYYGISDYESSYGPYDIVARVKGYEVGDKITIDGVSYNIVKKSETSALCFPHGENTPPSVVPIDLGIELEHQPTYDECKAIAGKIMMYFNPFKFVEPEAPELLDIQMNNTQIALSALVLVIVALNCGICYNYINNSRRKQFAIYKLCGAKTYHCFIVCMGEVALYLLTGYALAYLVFEHLLKDVLISFYPNIEGIYKPETYSYILYAYVIITLIVMSASLIKYACRPIVDERKQ